MAGDGRIKKNKYIIILILITAAFAGTAFIWKNNQSNKIESININVYGQSIIAEMYNKALSIVNKNNEYHLTYICNTKEPGKFCNCSNFEKTVSNEELTKFIKEVENLKDEGEKAKCCDHPWTEITIKYMSSKEKLLTFSMEPIDIEKTFSINCTVTN